MSSGFSTHQNHYPFFVDSPSSFLSSEDSSLINFSHESLPHESSSSLTQISQQQQPKRKIRGDDEACLTSSVQNKKEKKKKKGRGGSTDNGGHKEAPTGYIYVRAKRGQAKDSHSLAERVRREKLSERMKMLQGLVPGCDKVTGKAMMLDEIINYVQSLQNQVEFLSMKLASMSPMLSEFALDMDSIMNQPEKMEYLYCSSSNMVHQIPGTSSVFQSNHIQTNIDFLQHHLNSPISLDGVGGSDEQLQRQQQLQLQGLLHQVVFNNSMCPFQ